MSKLLSRRQFVQMGAILGAGLTLPQVVAGQEVTPEVPPTSPFEVTGSIGYVHDPVVIRGEDAYYLFYTGNGIPYRKSTNLVDWTRPFPQSVFTNTPDWIEAAIPNQQVIWAPDISYYNGKYHLYYAVSTFGSSRSVIGLATNVTLNNARDDYQWVDEGLVIESQPGFNYNCIDPNLVIDQEGVPWLAFGSFWSGIKMRRIDYATGKLSTEDETLYSIASRSNTTTAIEAPFIIWRDGYYYLFVSFDQCCQGLQSTYRTMVGRSEAITGPYVDADGVPMMESGGTQVTFPSEEYRGPGHCAVLQDENGTDYIVYHAYAYRRTGQSVLRIDPLVWDAEGWPHIEGQGPA